MCVQSINRDLAPLHFCVRCVTVTLRRPSGISVFLFFYFFCCFKFAALPTHESNGPAGRQPSRGEVFACAHSWEFHFSPKSTVIFDDFLLFRRGLCAHSSARSLPPFKCSKRVTNLWENEINPTENERTYQSVVTSDVVVCFTALCRVPLISWSSSTSRIYR